MTVRRQRLGGGHSPSTGGGARAASHHARVGAVLERGSGARNAACGAGTFLGSADPFYFTSVPNPSAPLEWRPQGTTISATRTHAHRLLSASQGAIIMATRTLIVCILLAPADAGFAFSSGSRLPVNHRPRSQPSKVAATPSKLPGGHGFFPFGKNLRINVAEWS